MSTRSHQRIHVIHLEMNEDNHENLMVIIRKLCLISHQIRVGCVVESFGLHPSRHGVSC